MPGNMGGMESEWERLGRLVRLARRQARLTQLQAAQAGGVSLAVWGLLERAAQAGYDDRTLAGVEDALSWPSGTVARILRDARFKPPAAPRATIGDREVLQEILDGVRRLLREESKWERRDRGNGDAGAGGR